MTFHGEHFHLDKVISRPTPMQRTGPPILMGADTVKTSLAQVSDLPRLHNLNKARDSDAAVEIVFLRFFRRPRTAFLIVLTVEWFRERDRR